MDQLCQAYHWSWADAMQCTVPQIVMLNHAAWVNQQRGEQRFAAKKEVEDAQRKQDEEDPIVWRGKRMSEMNSDETMQYYGGFWSATT